MIQRVVTLGTALALLLVTLSPAVLASSPEVEPELRQRVSQYWEAIRVADWATAYRLERVAQGTTPKDPFEYLNEKNTGLRMTRVTVESIEMQDNENSATANINGLVITSVGSVSIPIPNFYKSHWVRLDGHWFHDVDEPYTPDWLQAEIDALAKEEAARLEESARLHEAAQREQAATQASTDAGSPPTPSVPLPGGATTPAAQP